jgi:hypothetical protein
MLSIRPRSRTFLPKTFLTSAVAATAAGSWSSGPAGRAHPMSASSPTDWRIASASTEPTHGSAVLRVTTHIRKSTEMLRPMTASVSRATLRHWRQPHPRRRQTPSRVRLRRQTARAATCRKFPSPGATSSLPIIRSELCGLTKPIQTKAWVGPGSVDPR